MNKLAIIDVDRTLTDGSHRDYLVDCAEPDWKKYISAELVAKDTLIPGAYDVINKLTDMGFFPLFLTGRSEHLRSVTARWLNEWIGIDVTNPRVGALVMRAEGDDRVPSEYKKDRLIDIIMARKPDLLFAFDDDQYAWGAYERFGAVVFKAPECWSVLFPQADPKRPAETVWRK